MPVLKMAVCARHRDLKQESEWNPNLGADNSLKSRPGRWAEHILGVGCLH